MLDLKRLFWAQSWFQRMGYKKLTVTTRKVKVPEKVLEEIKISFFWIV